MNTQTVSPATARLLADAGFPQPAPAPGQWWGNGETLVFVWRAWIDEGHNYFIVSQTVADGRPIIDDYFDARDFTGLVCLPTMGDILRELPDYHIVFSDLYPPYGFTCFDKFDTAHDVIVTHESEHEAAALAWLQLHKKK